VKKLAIFSLVIVFAMGVYVNNIYADDPSDDSGGGGSCSICGDDLSDLSALAKAEHLLTCLDEEYPIDESPEIRTWECPCSIWYDYDEYQSHVCDQTYESEEPDFWECPCSMWYDFAEYQSHVCDQTYISDEGDFDLPTTLY